MRSTFILMIVYVFPFLTSAQSKQDSIFIKKISDEIFTNGQAYQELFQLTKNIGGRLAGSPQMVLAEDWAKDVLKDAGADDVEMQECKVPHWIRGGKDSATFTFTGRNKKPLTQSLNVLSLGNAVGTGSKGIKGELLSVGSFDELEQLKDQVKGKIVFYHCPFEETFVETFQSYGKNVKYRGIGASRAAKYGAIGVLVRSMTHADDNNPHTGAMGYNDSFPKIPAAAVGLDDVSRLLKVSAKNPPITVELFTNARMLPDTIGHNVVGILKGTSFPNQIITIGAHLDSWDVNEGAHDDGAGVVQVMEVLRTLKALGYQPKHTLHFVLFANEENGTRGAKKYAELAKLRKEQHLFALESDAGGFTPRGFGFTAKDSVWKKLTSWKTLFEPYGGNSFTEDGGGTDIYPLYKEFGTTVAELRPDSQRYFDVHHAKTDVFENVHKRELLLGAINMTALIYLVDQYGL